MTFQTPPPPPVRCTPPRPPNKAVIEVTIVGHDQWPNGDKKVVVRTALDEYLYLSPLTLELSRA